MNSLIPGPVPVDHVQAAAWYLNRAEFVNPLTVDERIAVAQVRALMAIAEALRATVPAPEPVG